MPDELQPYISEKAIGEKWLKVNNAFITTAGLFERMTREEKSAPVHISNKEFEQYDGAFFIANFVKDGRRAALKFPCSESDLENAMNETGAKSIEDCGIDTVSC